jgi:hypothetical protein
MLATELSVCHPERALVATDTCTALLLGAVQVRVSMSVVEMLRGVYPEPVEGLSMTFIKEKGTQDVKRTALIDDGT